MYSGKPGNNKVNIRNIILSCKKVDSDWLRDI